MVQRAEEHGFALALDQFGLREEIVLVNGALIQRPRVLRHPQRGKRTEQFRQVDRIVSRLADGERGILRIDLHRRSRKATSPARFE